MNRLRLVTSFVCLALCFFSGRSYGADPSVLGVQGSLVNGQSIRIIGNGFGSKNPSRPLIWADFDNSQAVPSSLGTITSWSNSANVTATTFIPHGGSHCISSPDLSTIGYFGVEVNSGNVTYGQRYYISLWRRVTYTEAQASCNLKWLRLWRTPGTLPDTYLGQPYNGWKMLNTEACNAQFDITNGWTYPNSNWRNEEYVYKFSSGPGNADGVFASYINGSTAFSRSSWISTCSGDSGVPGYIAIQENRSNEPRWAAGTNAYFDSIYIDTTWSRVILGNASSISASTHREIQIPSAWSDNEISVTVNLGSFQGGDTVYLFVSNSDNVFNSVGFPVQIGGEGGSPSTPTNLRPVSQ